MISLENKMKIPADWIKMNMFNGYSKELGRPLTEAEIRFQKCLEQLSVPNWYRTYSKPPKIRNVIPIEFRPSTWKTMSLKTPKKKSPKNSPSKSKTLESHPRADSGFNERRSTTPKTDDELSNVESPNKGSGHYYVVDSSEAESENSAKRRNSTSSCATSDCDGEQVIEALIHSPDLLCSSVDLDQTFVISREEDEDATQTKSSRSLFNISTKSNTFPRVSPSRKVHNINIVLPNPVPPRDVEVALSSPCKAFYEKTKHVDKCECGSCSNLRELDDPTQEEEEEDEEESNATDAPSPNTRFFNSKKKSTELEKIVQSKRTEPGNRGLIQEIIDELERSYAASEAPSQASSCLPYSEDSQSFVRSMVSALESNYDSVCDEDDGAESDGSCDSDLANSTTISIKSNDNRSYDSLDEATATPSPHLSTTLQCEHDSEEKKEEEEVKEEKKETKKEEAEVIYWIPNKRHIPRTSSRLSTQSKQSFGYLSDRCSPGLSPIGREGSADWLLRGWGLTYTKRASRQLLRIDESERAVDSGFSEATGTLDSRANMVTPSGYSTSSSSSPALDVSDSRSSLMSKSLSSYYDFGLISTRRG